MAEISNFKMTTSPHRLANQTTKGIMLDVIIALMPALIFGSIYFGLYAVMLVAICVITCLASEQLFNVIMKKPLTTDLSAIVTGLILGLNLPARAPWYLAVIGGVFAIIIVKMLFGGLGKNFANPAVCARVFLLLAYTSMANTFIKADTNFSTFFSFGDFTSTATYLSAGNVVLANSFMGVKGYWGQVLQLFFGAVGGSIGETSAFAVLIGGAYLLIRRVIDWRIPVVYLLTCAVFTLIFKQSGYEVLLQLFSGGLMFGAFFMATDYATSPKWKTNRILYAIGLGVITMCIRFYGSYPEGVSLAILIMNLLVPLMDRSLLPVRMGQKTKSGSYKKPVYAFTLNVLVALMLIGVIVASPIVASYEDIYKVGDNYDYKYIVEFTEDEHSYTFNCESKVYIKYYEGHPADGGDKTFKFKVEISQNDQTVIGITSLSDNPYDDASQDIKEIFLNKDYNSLLTLTESDLSNGSTYTKNTIYKMVKESYTFLINRNYINGGNL